MRIYQIGITFLLIFASAAAYAESGWFHQDGRDVVRTFRLANVAQDRDGLSDQQLHVPADASPKRENGIPDSSGHGAQRDPGQVIDNSRKGRLSLEERRALRRQIGEVGHDIYAPKR